MNYLIPVKTGFQPRWRELKDRLKEIPGFQAEFINGKFSRWLCPIECLEQAAAMAKEMGVSLCVDPLHLMLGTQSENIKDAWVKGRIKGNTKRGTA